jgi:hypothetical protein
LGSVSSGDVQWKSALLFPLRQRIVVAMEARHDELGSSAAHPTELLLLFFFFFCVVQIVAFTLSGFFLFKVEPMI